MPGHQHASRPSRSRGWLTISVILLLVAGVAIGLLTTRSTATKSRTSSKKHSTPAPSRTTTSSVGPGGSSSPTPVGSATSTSTAGLLAGKVVAIDPGHNGGNFGDPSFINSPIWNGRATETCDTTGTETDGGYTEAQFNFNVAQYLAADLEAKGAKVVMTRTTNDGVGPCVTQRAAIGNAAGANAAVSIHADGGPTSGSGFAVLEPVASGPNDSVVTPSQSLGTDVRSAFLAQNVEPISDYDGIDGIQPRDDLAGLNLTTVPKVLVECANMRNTSDAALIVTDSWQRSVAQALTTAITKFLMVG